jgi:hypothetical protein
MGTEGLQAEYYELWQKALQEVQGLADKLGDVQAENATLKRHLSVLIHSRGLSEKEWHEAVAEAKKALKAGKSEQ